jgi:hypothetical protein
MKDKFEMLTEIMNREMECNHSYIYITVNQLYNIIHTVNDIYNNWDETKSLKENTELYYERIIRPMGDAGTNRI